jgi:hypothetical protein
MVTHALAGEALRNPKQTTAGTDNLFRVLIMMPAGSKTNAQMIAPDQAL